MAFNQKKFLDSAGVSTLWSRINAQLVARDAEIAKNKAAIEAEATAARAAEKANADAAAANKTAIEAEVARAKAAEKANADAIVELQTDMGNMDGVSTKAKNVAGAIDELKNAIGAGGTAAAITLTASDSADFAKVYTLKQGENEVGVINIPKDMVVSAGEVVVDPEGQAKGTYIKLTLANSQTPLFINVADLVDVYVAQAGAAEVQLTIGAGNIISAVIVDGAVGTAKIADGAVTTAKIADANVTLEKLSSGVQASLAKADAAASKTELKTEQDRIKALENKFGGAEGSIEDQIADAEKAAKDYADGLAKNYATAAQGTKADTALQQGDITTGTIAGTIKVKGVDIGVSGLGSAAFEDVDAFDAAGTADEVYKAIVALSDADIDAAIAAATPNQG